MSRWSSTTLTGDAHLSGASYIIHQSFLSLGLVPGVRRVGTGLTLQGRPASFHLVGFPSGM